MRTLSLAPLSRRLTKIPFFAELLQNGAPLEAVRQLDRAGARQPLDALSVLATFPVLSERTAVRASELSHLIMLLAPAAAHALATGFGAREDISKLQLGASAPSQSAWQDGAEVPDEAEATEEALGTPPLPSVLSLCRQWPIRDQGSRGTCVAFATAAMLEAYSCVKDGASPQLSEQFHYWCIKTNTNDPFPTQDGTRLEFARDAMAKHGICTGNLWPYSPQVVLGNAAHKGLGGPRPAAVNDAARRLRQLVHHVGVQGGNAAPVLAAVLAGNPVAVSLPVFWDPYTQRSNWHTPSSRLHGFVADPPTASIVSGGHAVCIVGFAPDNTEPLGGHFVIRNSWSTAWGSNLPSPGYFAPEPGYGQISLSYVDKYLWEWLTF